MDVFQGWADLPAGIQAVFTIGVFDGVHLGHQSLIRGVVEQARSCAGQAVVLTFHPHPRSVVAPDSSWGYLCSLEERIDRLADLETDLLILLRFSRELAATPAEAFVDQVLQHMHLREIHVGEDFALGQGKRGDAALLHQLGRRHGFVVRSIPPVCLEGQVVSSTRIRELVQAGHVAAVARWLGRLFSLRGSVISGAGQGRRLGFPTANLLLHPRQILPADGVYAAQVRMPPALSVPSPLPALAYIGRRPTFGPGERAVEIHLLDFSGDLLGYELRAELVQHLRPDHAFRSAQDLVVQMQRDAAQARALLSDVTAQTGQGTDKG